MDVIIIIDACGRNINYMRMSITNECNLKCIYCSRERSQSCNKRGAALSVSNYTAIVKAAAALGVTKVRITGGEPLTRTDICSIISAVSSVNHISDVAITTNGVFLAEMAKELKNAGLKGINISLDTLERKKFEKITGEDKLTDVLAGIDAAMEAGISPVKINTIVIKGLNDMEIEGFIRLAKLYPIDVRFIELMPIGAFGEKNRDKIEYNSEILRKYPCLHLTDCGREFSDGPARYYTAEGFRGRIGFISPMSHKFCKNCNRIRLTYDGRLKPCLGENGETDITGLIGSPTELKKAMEKIIFNKPNEHHFESEFSSVRNMSEIGG
jgi:cyclic pyranopterin phosphate synthase